MLGIAGVRTEFVQGTRYKLPSEGTFLTVVPFVFAGLQSSAKAESLLLLVRLHLRFLEQGRDTRKRASGNECPWASQKRIAEHDFGVGVNQWSK
jgi:hypothetical protein